MHRRNKRNKKLCQPVWLRENIYVNINSTDLVYLVARLRWKRFRRISRQQCRQSQSGDTTLDRSHALLMRWQQSNNGMGVMPPYKKEPLSFRFPTSDSCLRPGDQADRKKQVPDVFLFRLDPGDHWREFSREKRERGGGGGSSTTTLTAACPIYVARQHAAESSTARNFQSVKKKCSGLRTMCAQGRGFLSDLPRRCVRALAALFVAVAVVSQLQKPGSAPCTTYIRMSSVCRHG